MARTDSRDEAAGYSFPEDVGARAQKAELQGYLIPGDVVGHQPPPPPLPPPPSPARPQPERKRSKEGVAEKKRAASPAAAARKKSAVRLPRRSDSGDVGGHGIDPNPCYSELPAMEPQVASCWKTLGTLAVVGRGLSLTAVLALLALAAVSTADVADGVLGDVRPDEVAGAHDDVLAVRARLKGAMGAAVAVAVLLGLAILSSILGVVGLWLEHVVSLTLGLVFCVIWGICFLILGALTGLSVATIPSDWKANEAALSTAVGLAMQDRSVAAQIEERLSCCGSVGLNYSYCQPLGSPAAFASFVDEDMAKLSTGKAEPVPLSAWAPALAAQEADSSIALSPAKRLEAAAQTLDNPDPDPSPEERTAAWAAMVKANPKSGKLTAFMAGHSVREVVFGAIKGQSLVSAQQQSSRKLKSLLGSLRLWKKDQNESKPGAYHHRLQLAWTLLAWECLAPHSCCKSTTACRREKPRYLEADGDRYFRFLPYEAEHLKRYNRQSCGSALRDHVRGLLLGASVGLGLGLFFALAEAVVLGLARGAILDGDVDDVHSRTLPSGPPDETEPPLDRKGSDGSKEKGGTRESTSTDTSLFGKTGSTETPPAAVPYPFNALSTAPPPLPAAPPPGDYAAPRAVVS